MRTGKIFYCTDPWCRLLTFNGKLYEIPAKHLSDIACDICQRHLFSSVEGICEPVITNSFRGIDGSSCTLWETTLWSLRAWWADVVEAKWSGCSFSPCCSLFIHAPTLLPIKWYCARLLCEKSKVPTRTNPSKPRGLRSVISSFVQIWLSHCCHTFLAVTQWAAPGSTKIGLCRISK